MTKIIETPILETERLILRPLILEDAPIIQKYFNNWNIIKNLNDKVPWPYPDNGADDFIKNDAMPRIAKGETFMWSILLKGEFIGLIEYRAIKKEGEQEDRGFWLAEPYWKQGYMSEAVTAVNDFIFFGLKKERISVQNYADNAGSHRVKEKTGSRFLDTQTEKWRGKDREVELWELTAENWRKFREQEL